jgi:hypothetical protein
MRFLSRLLANWLANIGGGKRRQCWLAKVEFLRNPLFLLISLLTFTKVSLMSAQTIKEHAMPAGRHAVFRPEQAEIACPCCTLDTSMLRLQPLAANGLPLSEREAGMP